MTTPTPTPTPTPHRPRLAPTFLAGLVVLAAAVALPRAAAACSCAPPGEPAAELARSDVVVSGEVVSIEPVGDDPERLQGFGQLRVTLELHRVWKGVPEDDELVVVTAADSAMCGYPFTRGERYLVYANDSSETPPEDLADRELTVNICSRTALLGSAEKDVAALGEPERVVVDRMPEK